MAGCHARSARYGLETRVVLLTGPSDWELECLRLGVRGVVRRIWRPSSCNACAVYAGDVWVEKHSITQAVDLMLRREPEDASSPVAHARRSR